ncbi:dTDP-glucose 4,6-dehydratase [Patescibacteria group bacterium]
MNLLITGGAGFIGSNFIRYIFKKYPGYKIINLDKLAYYDNLDNLRDIEKDFRYAFVNGDIRDELVVDKLVSHRPDAIINFASDILGTQILLESAKKYNIGCYFHISTGEVYGSINCGSFFETSNLDPDTKQSALIAGSDLIVRAYYKMFDLPILITRCSNNYGPYQYPKKFIPFFIINLLQDKKVPVYGGGRQVHDWIYVLDHCSAIDCVLHHGRIGEIYNVGSGNEITNLKVVNLLLNLLGKDELCIEHVEDSYGHDKRYSIESSKIRRLGWRPKYMFDQAISDTVDWYVNNSQWWKKKYNVVK